MKKKLVAVLGVLALMIGMITVPVQEVKAAESGQVIIDGSVLLDDVDESVGEIVKLIRGAYLQTGSSSIAEIGSGKIQVGGTTIAQRVVPTIKIGVMVERMAGSNWVSYTSWSATGNNDFALDSYKELTVPRGYYYRVRCIHTAYTDTGHSNTSGIYVH